MADINSKMQDFYLKGRKDGVNDCDNFLRLVGEKYADVQLQTGITMQQFLEIVAQQMTKHLGGGQQRR